MGSVSLSIIFGLISALTYGAADFTGGLIAKRTSSLGIVILGHIGSLLLLVPFALLFGEALPPGRDLFFAILAGVAGGTGLMLLYRALAEGQMSLASPVSALVAASIPVLVGLWTQGLPGTTMLIGFALALAAIWLIAQNGKISLVNILAQVRLPFISGIFFGLFFVGMAQGSAHAVIWPVVATRIGSIPSLLLYAFLTRQRWLPVRKHWGSIGLISLLDTAGNLLYILASQVGRLDLAALVSSLYPGSTVALARIILKEKITPSQVVGILCALVALLFISL
jgi:drug/metabolite transporter (DMT)-like permease